MFIASNVSAGGWSFSKIRVERGGKCIQQKVGYALPDAQKHKKKHENGGEGRWGGWSGAGKQMGKEPYTRIAPLELRVGEKLGVTWGTA